MSDGSTIEWLDRPGTKPATWNPLRARETRTGKTGWHCEHVHEGCRFCYAERINKRLGTKLEYKPGLVLKEFNFLLAGREPDQPAGVVPFLDEKTLLQPLKWKHPRTIFVCSMTDLYGPWVTDEMLDKIKAVQDLTPQHTYIELTKRPERMREYATRLHDEPAQETARRLAAAWPIGVTIPSEGVEIPLPNVWGLVSCSTQEDADKFIPILLNTPLAIRGVSAEPLLGDIDFTRLAMTGMEHINAMCGVQRVDTGKPSPKFQHCAKLDWIIIGGESGRNARPMHPDWARAIVSQCEAAAVACFFKQWGEWAPHAGSAAAWPSSSNPVACTNYHNFYSADRKIERQVFRIGKARAGRLLDGREHNGFPQARTT